MDNGGHVLTNEEYEEFNRLRNLLNNNEGFNGIYGANQRVMGDEQQGYIIPKVKFTGNNVEEFVTKFSHIAEAYRVTRILYEDYGKNPPPQNTPEFQEWTAQDSRAYRLLERHVDPGDLVLHSRQARHVGQGDI
jgi:hypothetical protein